MGIRLLSSSHCCHQLRRAKAIMRLHLLELLNCYRMWHFFNLTLMVAGRFHCHTVVAYSFYSYVKENMPLLLSHRQTAVDFTADRQQFTLTLAGEDAYLTSANC